VSDLLCADCVGKSYRGRRILSSASLRAVPGELRVLFGRNGAGKSTLLKIGGGCLEPDTGHVRWDGEALTRVSLPVLARRGLFYLPDHDLLSDAFTIRRQLEMVRPQYDGLSPDDAVLVRQPRCLLADEPYRGVAPKDADVLTRVLRDLALSGVAVVVTGHEIPTLLAAADHVTWCVSGTTYELGAPELAAQDERFRREYLGAGLTRAHS